MERLPNIHPGEVLLEEFLKPMNISAYRLSKDIGIPQTRTSEIIKGLRRITADTALRLSYYFGNSAKFWLGLQNDYDIEEERRAKKEEFKSIKKRQTTRSLTGRYMQLALRTARTFWLKRTAKWSAVRPAPAPAGDSLLVSRFLPTRE